ncbi:CDP-diacylglycerol--glycerol-3-phosphate 3-phosphatidyltransferase [Candidatus Nesciobacter abundans]|uniref:CDP-diacylglycerol--glycerol-3-phosphate 3-phosphatidyltransferase n=1 Tax=Candidatus Nesciobacter abundans TaxID=2601668 RepID=A0A5C0UH00_9PROT|nr:CDP-diacylglycerol--glycerol-3-phosphate 3-phosphatidyltransferase [Candidatus Nesciobacter abundans]QEK39079.1 CDP-diacylglycerol--glycerol-3-phosphate 3-phosphatidyltransferase [Candidatus Nesciobacter abundans]
MISPNLLTIFRIFVTPFICLLIIFKMKLLSAVLFLIACISDFLDGFIARKYKSKTSIGQHLDPMADKILLTSILVTLIQTGHIKGIHTTTVYLIIVRNIFVYFLRNYMNAIKKRNIYVNNFGKTTTISQMVSMGMLLLDIKGGMLLLWLSMLFSFFSLFVYLHKSLLNNNPNKIS